MYGGKKGDGIWESGFYLQDRAGSMEELCLLAHCSSYLAEGFDQGMELTQLVTRDHREKVMIDLIPKTTTEPLNKEVALDITCGSDLELPEVWSLISIIDSHTIVTKTKD